VVVVVSIVGARPQFVKAAMVSQALRAHGVREVLVHTGQHYDDNMSNVFFDELDMAPPDHNLGVGSGPHGSQTGQMLAGIEDVLLQHRPDYAVVYGDTNSTLAGALAAAKLQIPVAHVEAGLRSFNRAMPEELNRVLTDHLSSTLFAPTATALENLKREGIDDSRVKFVGDVMFDACLHYGGIAESRSTILDRVGLASRGYVLATVHRAENTDDVKRFRSIFGALAEIAREMSVVFPVHPRTRRLVDAMTSECFVPDLHLIEPVGYLDMLMLEKHSALIATDSGGVQKEAFFYRVPSVTLRTETEWVELCELGWNRLAPPGDAHRIAETMRTAMRAGPGKEATPYGRGDAAQAIAGQFGRLPGDGSK
jgi:UDP-GlcNAc3NAcA epimerase